MKLPLSLHSRIGLLSIVIVIALLFLNMNALLSVSEGTVVGKLDVHLDSQIGMLMRSIDDGGHFHPEGIVAAPDLVSPDNGWGWEIRTAAGEWSRGVRPGDIYYPIPHFHVNHGIYSGRGAAVGGLKVHVRRLDSSLAAGPVTIIVMSPRRDIDAELYQVRVQMYKIAAQIVLFLIAASVLQIVIGLHPLRKIVRDVAKVRSGEAQSLSEHQPSELQPLASEINALISRNNAGLATARLHAANLAHAVKTPLASLMLQLEYEGASAEAQYLVGQLSKSVAHHLHRARSVAAGAQGNHRSDAGIVAHRVRSTILLAHRDKPLSIDISVPATCLVAVEEEDLGEMIANLVENACRYTRSRVDISGSIDDGRVRLVIEDDGPGIPGDKLAAAVRPGTRLDESGTGYGLGLAIVSELAELYGGSLELCSSHRLGGLCAMLTLPR